MVAKLKDLHCNLHLCRRVADTFGFKDVSTILSNMSLKKVDKTNHFGIVIPTKCLTSVCSNYSHSKMLDMKSDEIIQQVYECPEEDSIVFNIKKEVLMDSLLTANLCPQKDETLQRKKTVLVEFSSPNIAKPFHVGHLRSTIIGNFVANITELKHTVKRLNYLGDWGTQIGFIKAGLEASNETDVSLLQNPMKSLYNAYTLAYSDENMVPKAKEIFSNLEKGTSPEWQEVWEKIRSITIDHLRKTYSSFGINFDEYTFESKYRAANISPVVELMGKNNLTIFDNNCLAMVMNDEKVPLFKSDGTSLYLVRDIAAALDRIKVYNADKLVYVVDKSQSEHLNRLKYAVSKLTQLDIVSHVSFGRITGMSTRKGTSIFLDDILNETVDKMAEQQSKSPNTRTSNPEVTRILGVTALMVYILRQRRNRDFIFSWENALQGTGDTGIKLQYTHSRLCSLEKRCNVTLPKEAVPSALKEPIIFDLIFELARYSQVLQSSQDKLESSYLVSYLFKLCNLVSRCLKDLPVKGQNNDLAAQRLLLFHISRCTINSCMKILGLQPLIEM